MGSLCTLPRSMGTLTLGRLKFSNALHVPGLLYTLISEPQLDKEGYEMQSSGKSDTFIGMATYNLQLLVLYEMGPISWTSLKTMRLQLLMQKSRIRQTYGIFS